MNEALPEGASRDVLVETLLEMWARQGRRGWIRIEGYSMSPLLRPGDAVLITYGDSSLHRGDILIYRRGGCLVVHRLLGWQGDGSLLLAGDNELRLDESVAPAAVLGRAVAICARGRQYRAGDWRVSLMTRWILLMARARHSPTVWRVICLLNTLTARLLLP